MIKLLSVKGKYFVARVKERYCVGVSGDGTVRFASGGSLVVPWVQLTGMGTYNGAYPIWWMKTYEAGDKVEKNNYILTACIIWPSGGDEVYIAHHNTYVGCSNATVLSAKLDGGFFSSNNGSNDKFYKVRITEPLRSQLLSKGLIVQDGKPHFYVLGNAKGSGGNDIDSLDNLRPLIATNGNKPFIRVDSVDYNWGGSSMRPIV